MLEAGLVFDFQGGLIHWHLPLDRSGGALPDSRNLWKVLWDNRAILGGVAHTHPWNGSPSPSSTDVTTFAAVEKGLGLKLVWPIVTFTEVGYFEWVGPKRLDYLVMGQRRFRIHRELIEQLRDLSSSKIEGSNPH
jgi:hypothetical protein